jgi:polyhydroxyalkanoate synthase
MDIQPERRRHIRPSGKGDATLKFVATGQTRKPPRHSAELPAAAPDSSFIRDSYSSTAVAEIIDRAVHAATARLTAGLSPMMLISAYMDWAAHLGFSPGKRLQLVEKAIKNSIRLARYASRRVAGTDGLEPCIVPLRQDQRFLGKAWQSAPYDPIYQSFLLTQQWWYNAVTGVRGVTRQHENTVALPHARSC